MGVKLTFCRTWFFSRAVCTSCRPATDSAQLFPLEDEGEDHVCGAVPVDQPVGAHTARPVPHLARGRVGSAKADRRLDDAPPSLPHARQVQQALDHGPSTHPIPNERDWPVTLNALLQHSCEVLATEVRTHLHEGPGVVDHGCKAHEGAGDGEGSKSRAHNNSSRNAYSIAPRLLCNELRQHVTHLTKLRTLPSKGEGLAAVGGDIAERCVPHIPAAVLRVLKPPRNADSNREARARINEIEGEI
eukprot:CAMPEP_0206241790 /NCGR_PEP_ID=MMETSP0047_2-20121206/16695_1 /ASSEMBLY_ACC=CAM_ASM_000192 /TAXON_ID=195065 /ORGANISM="Chroomonas mesostigmatica_cf, Strain CCMP1168" /LENGTH=244 /DNA_ID=CAMNT_0053666733 /DNA_START=192 /DNA_END=925 /DNA_ORIENTATION=-